MSHSHIPIERHRLVRLLGVTTTLIGCLVLIGWLLNIPPLKSLLLAGATMKANTALCFIAASISLGLQTHTERLARHIATASAIGISTIALLTLCQYLFGVNFGIDELLAADRPISPATRFPGRMGMNTAVCFMLSAAALWLSARSRSLRIAQALGAISGTIALHALVGYAYQVRVFYQFSYATTSMAVPTAIAFLDLNTGILALSANRGWMRSLTGNSIGGKVARRLVPGAIGLPLVLGWAILQGYRAGYYDGNFAMSLLAISLAFILFGLIKRTIDILDRLESERSRAAARLRSSEARFQRLADNIPAAIYQYVRYPDGTNAFTYISDRCREIYEYTPAELMANSGLIWDSIHPDDIPLVAASDRAATERLEPFAAEFRLVPPSGRWRWVQAFARPERQADGSILSDGIIMDITDRQLDRLNEQFLLDLEVQLRRESDPQTMARITVERVGAHLQLDRALWVEIDADIPLATVAQDWYQQPNLSSIVGVYPLLDFVQTPLITRLTAGDPVAIDDVSSHPDTAAFAARYSTLDVQAFAVVPCLVRDRWVAAIMIHSQTPRHWRKDEIDLLREVVTRLWPTIDRARALKALQHSERNLRDRLVEIETLYRTAPIGLAALDLDLRYLRVNQLMAEINGISIDEHLDRTVFEVAPTVAAEVVRIRDRMLASREPALDLEITGETLKCPGIERTWNVSWFPLCDGNEEIIGITVIVQNITERKQAERERENLLERERLARLEAEALNRLKDEFLAALSHELRTPLHPILGWTQMLQTRQVAPAKLAQALQSIERNVRQQIAIVDDLLDISNAVRGELQLHPRSLDLADCLDRAIANLSFAAQIKNIAIERQGLPSLKISGDRDRLQQICWNLLSNAIKFTPDGGRVEIALDRANDGKTATIRFTDNGIGIDPEFVPHVFDRFLQADGTITRQYGGLGLGLAIVRHLVELHGGQISVCSKPGAGSTFAIALPMGEFEN